MNEKLKYYDLISSILTMYEQNLADAQDLYNAKFKTTGKKLLPRSDQNLFTFGAIYYFCGWHSCRPQIFYQILTNIYSIEENPGNIWNGSVDTKFNVRSTARNCVCIFYITQDLVHVVPTLFSC